MKLTTKKLVLASLIVMFVYSLAGCSGEGSVVTPDTSNPITFKEGSKTTYQQNYLDTTGGVYGKDSINTASGDTLTQTLMVKGMRYGRINDTASNVNMFVSTHSKAGVFNDTIYMRQVSTGDLYTYDYGVEVLNNNPYVVAFNGGQKFHIGWTLQMKMGASVGTGWLARDTGFAVPLVGQVEIRDTATMMKDTTLSIAGEVIDVKHAVHNVSVLSLLATGTTAVDSYVSTKYGTIFNVVHSLQLSGSVTNRVVGVRKIMLTHSN